MAPTPAELIRTLVAGRLPGLVHLAHRPGPHHVRHATDPDGRVLLLVPVGQRPGRRTGAGRRGQRRRRGARRARPAARRRRARRRPGLGLRLGGRAATATRPVTPRSTSPPWSRPVTCSTWAAGSGCTASRWPRPAGDSRRGAPDRPGEYAAAEPDPVHAGRGRAAGRPRRPPRRPGGGYLRRQAPLDRADPGRAAAGWWRMATGAGLVRRPRPNPVPSRRVRLAFPGPSDATPADRRP